jgi:Eco57I restriction-modification methylase
MTPDDFLAERESRFIWPVPDGAPSRLGLTPVAAFAGRGSHALEVALATTGSRPRADDIRRAWKSRHGGAPSPLLLVVAYEANGAWKSSICGPTGDEPPVEVDLDLGLVERIAAAALNQPSRHQAIRFLSGILAEVESELPGIRNHGMLATQELRDGVPQRADWPQACERAQPLLGSNGRELVEKLGFNIEHHSTATTILSIGDARRAVAVFLDETEEFEAPSARFGDTSPVTHALAYADRAELPWVVVTRGTQIRLYAAKPDVGVGRKGRADTYVEANLALVPDDRAGYVTLLFSADALKTDGTLTEIIDTSRDYAAALGARLRDRVYEEAVPTLALALAKRHAGELDEAALEAIYEQALTVLFRLLFVAYAEDKDLLPYRSNGAYRDHALKTLARDLAERHATRPLVFDDNATDLWTDVASLWTAVDKGNVERGVPSYNGGLFSTDPAVNAAGAALNDLTLTNAEYGPALVALLVDEGEDEVMGPVDFRSLSVREFGTIYEGLLESRLSVAPSNLALDSKRNYVPASDGDEVVVEAGAVYFHNRSGARKSSGTYFTKPFAVEHLLDHALEPALDDHLARILELVGADEEAKAAEAFFDFRCVDLAMGSGHFLVAAVDRIEARLSAFLALHPIPRVTAELDRLRAAAYDALGPLGEGVEIEHASLLRRQVARRCVYGVDMNPVAVELARLGIWIHTFVPGLPLSFLDHSLVSGDSLTGIGTLDEAIQSLDPEHVAGQTSLFRDQIVSVLGRAESALQRLAHVAEASKAEIDAAREAQRDAENAVAPARDLFDLIVAERLGEAAPSHTFDEDDLQRNADLDHARKLREQLYALHFPIAFPEVFLRERAGFDCIIGNPPWEKMMFKTDVFWTLRYPGLKALPVSEMNHEINRLRDVRPDLAREEIEEQNYVDKLRAALLSGPYPELESGHVDLYKAFAWRMLALAGRGALIGVVLPRSALSSFGSAGWRAAVAEAGGFADLTTLINSGGWVFDDAEHRYTIALTTTAVRPDEAPTLTMRGPYSSLRDYQAGVGSTPFVVDPEHLHRWSPRGVFPLLPTTEAGSVFSRLQEHPPLSDSQHGWRFRPIQGDFNSTSDKQFMRFDETNEEIWHVYSGKSFNIWRPDTGEYYAAADPDIVQNELMRRRASGFRNSRSAFSELTRDLVDDPTTLPCLRPRISYRKIVRSTDSRTVIAALIPPYVIATTANPYLLRIRGDERDEAYLLGVLTSIPFDWLHDVTSKSTSIFIY